MAGRTRLKLLIGVAVFAAHIAALDRFARELDHSSVLEKTVPPMLTRLLQAQAPPAPPAQPVPAPAAPKARTKRPPPREGSVAATLPAPQPQPVASEPEAATTTMAANEAAPAASAPAEPASAPPAPEPAVQAASAQASDTPAPPLETWPTDTRLSYRLDGNFRGQLYGDARVQWQRDGGNYQVKLDIDITPWVTMVMTSQGRVTDNGLAPRAYEEERRGKRRTAQFGDRAVQLDGGRSAPKPDGVQDTASQFVELTHRFATGKARLEVGKSVSFWMARPGAVDLWTYDIVERVMLDTPQHGAIEAFHLKPRPLANPRGNVYAEMWYAPSLQYLPVRIKVSMGDEAYVDLLVEKIEQR